MSVAWETPFRVWEKSIAVTLLFVASSASGGSRRRCREDAEQHWCPLADNKRRVGGISDLDIGRISIPPAFPGERPAAVCGHQGWEVCLRLGNGLPRRVTDRRDTSIQLQCSPPILGPRVLFVRQRRLHHGVPRLLALHNLFEGD